MTVDNFTFDELRDLYRRYFTLGNMGNDINNKFALISLVCYSTYLLKQQDPDITPYVVLKRITKDDITIPDQFLVAIAIICEDMMYDTKEFPTFGIAVENIKSTILKLLNKYLPF